MAQTSIDEATQNAAAGGKGSPVRAILLLVAIATVVFNRRIASSISLDWLNIVPLLAVLYIGYCVVALGKVFPRSRFVRSRLEPTGKKPWGTFLLSPSFRSLLLIPLLLMAVEFGLRCVSYHRALLYERQGDLLFTPVPNQEYTEKVSLTHSFINDWGLRGGPATVAGKQVVLTLGDSITYGYGVDDQHTYPASLQTVLDQKFPGQYAVLNGGVDAYPVSFEHQKFLYLWNRGVHPNLVIVGYSFNEGGLGHLVYSDQKTKDQFAQRVRMKNSVRSIALYNLIVENWARHDYDKMKKYMVPGTNFKNMSEDDVNVLYARQLTEFVTDLRARNVQPIFLLFCGYDGRSNSYDDSGPFQKRFADFAEKNGITLLRSKNALLQGLSEGADLSAYFQDPSHMKPPGTLKVAEMLAGVVAQPGQPRNAGQ